MPRSKRTTKRLTPAQRAKETLYAAAQEARNHGMAVIIWSADDVQSLREDWDRATCEEAMADVADELQDLSISSGWDHLEGLLPDE